MSRDVDDLKAWLPGVALFGGLTESTVERVIALLGVHQVQPGDAVCQQGESGRAMFLVRTGEVMVCRDLPDGRRVKLVRMGPGEFFGEMTLIDVQRRSASVYAEAPSLLYSLGNRDLYTLYQQDITGYVMVLQNLCRELSRRLRATNRSLQALAESDDLDDTLIRPVVRR